MTFENTGTGRNERDGESEPEREDSPRRHEGDEGDEEKDGNAPRRDPTAGKLPLALSPNRRKKCAPSWRIF
jgi:hypothetical protein